MRTLYPLLVVLALGAATIVWTLSGVGAIYGVSDPIGDGSPASDALENQAENSSANQGVESSARSSGDSVVGLIFSGLGTIVSVASMVVLLPWELQRLGFPHYFAYPIGLLAQTLVGVGIIQFATNREYL